MDQGRHGPWICRKNRQSSQADSSFPHARGCQSADGPAYDSTIGSQAMKCTPAHIRGAMSLGILVILAASGCSGGPAIPPTHPVKGKITYKGQPLADAEVAFVSRLDNKDVKPAGGRTNASGEYSLATYIDPEHEVSGATTGEFIVTIQKTEQMDDQKMMEEFQKNPMMEFKPLIPVKYSDPKLTPFAATVEAGKTNTFDFVLEEK